MIDVAVVGAGLAGLTAARALAEAGRRPVLLDKGRRPGGRCATRTLGAAAADTGAQFFTVRSGTFAGLVDRWRGEGVAIHEWSQGFAHARSIADGPAMADVAPDGHSRYSVVGGMNALAAHLARYVDVRSATRVTAIMAGGDGWVLELLDQEGHPTRLEADAVVLTAPVPQALALLGNGDVTAPAGLRALAYEPCLTLLAALDRPLALPGPGAVQFAQGPVSWLADNVAKGASTAPSLTVHAAGDWSEALYDADPALVGRLLLDLVEPWLGSAGPVATQTFRWRYSRSRNPVHDRAVTVAPALVLAGDALAGAKVEGAVTSGLAAADLLVR